jgi:hypothetical protein
LKNFLREFRIEVIAILLALLGVFLLVEQIEIRSTLRNWLSSSSGWLAQLAHAAIDSLVHYIQSFSPSDLVGWILIFSTTVFLVWRIRYHFLHSERWRAHACPRCGSSLHRIHRTNLDRLLTRTLLPKGNRYLCSNPECRWTGLRRRTGQHGSESPEVSSQAQV